MGCIKMNVRWDVYCYSGGDHYKLTVESADVVKKIVKTGTVEQIVKVVTTTTTWSPAGCGDYTIPADWSEDETQNDHAG